MSSIVRGEAPVINLAEDLEDGEIDEDDDEEEEQQKPTASAAGNNNNNSSHCHNNTSADDIQFLGIERKPDKSLVAAPDDEVVFLGLSGEAQPAASSSGNKSKKPRPLEGKRNCNYHGPLSKQLSLSASSPLSLTLLDDHAVSIENAIAKALKKSGIEPPMPKIHNNSTLNSGSNSTASSNNNNNNNSNNNHSEADNSHVAGNIVAGDSAATVGANQNAGQQQQQQQQQNSLSRSSRRRKRKKEREREQKKDFEQVCCAAPPPPMICLCYGYASKCKRC